MLPHKTQISSGYPAKHFYSRAKAASKASSAHKRKIKAVLEVGHQKSNWWGRGREQDISFHLSLWWDELSNHSNISTRLPTLNLLCGIESIKRLIYSTKFNIWFVIKIKNVIILILLFKLCTWIILAEIANLCLICARIFTAFIIRTGPGFLKPGLYLVLCIIYFPKKVWVTGIGECVGMCRNKKWKTTTNRKLIPVNNEARGNPFLHPSDSLDKDSRPGRQKQKRALRSHSDPGWLHWHVSGRVPALCLLAMPAVSGGPVRQATDTRHFYFACYLHEASTQTVYYIHAAYADGGLC